MATRERSDRKSTLCCPFWAYNLVPPSRGTINLAPNQFFPFFPSGGETGGQPSKVRVSPCFSGLSEEEACQDKRSARYRRQADMDYEATRRFMPSSHAFSTSVYHDRSAPLALAHDGKVNARTWPLGNLGGSIYHRANMGGEDPIEAGPARRRIAVACARCRKRKIRCSGDLGNGTGCTSCRQAGIAPTQCQFHRVGSDNVQKVMDNISVAQSLTSMANANGLMPIYSSDNPIFPGSSPVEQYPHIDSKTMYNNTWSIPYSEDTSPTDAYGLEHSPTYPQTPASILTNTNGDNPYMSPYRWTHCVAKSSANDYFDQESSYTAQGLPYLQTNFQVPVTDAVSPLSMSSLQLTLPTRPHPRQRQFSEAVAPQRQLPMPLPSPAQASRNVVDRLQDQRLRSAQALGVSTSNVGSPFFKPFLPWNGGGDNQNNAPQETTSEGQTATTDFATVTSPVNDSVKATAAEPQLQLNFTTSTLAEAMNATAPPAPYSDFRGSRSHSSMSTQMARQPSQPNSYSFTTDRFSKRNSLGGESNNCSKLSSGQQYNPLPHSRPPDLPAATAPKQDSFIKQRISVNRA